MKVLFDLLAKLADGLGGRVPAGTMTKGAGVVAIILGVADLILRALHTFEPSVPAPVTEPEAATALILGGLTAIGLRRAM